MSRGLGHIQQAVLAALRQHGGSADIRTLVVDVTHPQAPNDPVDPELHYEIHRGVAVRDTAGYQSVVRAIRRLEQSGLVRTSWQRANTSALVSRSEVSWKQVYLTTHPRSATMILSQSWDCWAQQEGYKQCERVRLTSDGQQMLEIWERDAPVHPYLIVLLGMSTDCGAVVLPCLSRLGMRETIRRVQKLLQQSGQNSTWDGPTLIAQLQISRER